jgi:hypothetical protein
VSRFHDDLGVWRIPDEQLMAGEAVPDEPELTSFVAALRASATDEAPAPTPELAALLEAGLAPRRARPSAARGSGGGRLRRAGVTAGVVLVGKVALAGAAAAVGVVGVAHFDGAPSVVRTPAQSVVDAVVDAWHGVSGTPAAPAPSPTAPAPTDGAAGKHPAPPVPGPCWTPCALAPAPALPEIPAEPAPSQVPNRTGTIHRVVPSSAPTQANPAPPSPPANPDATPSAAATSQPSTGAGHGHRPTPAPSGTAKFSRP